MTTYPMVKKFKFCCTNTMAEYEPCILGLRMTLDMEIHELLVIGDSDLLIHQVQGEWATKNAKILPYVNLAQRLYKTFKEIEFKHTPRAQNEFADGLATIASMIQHPESSHIDPLEISLREEHAYCSQLEVEPDGKSWYTDIKTYLEKEEYPESTIRNQRKTIRRMANGFFLRAGYYWMTRETDCCKFVQRCHQCQIHRDLIRVLPSELNVMS
ncbi:uncharacterized protein LOC132611853 [Lycium barbarum]|uniref:uncharacterized protein LOC132611853 n=1 Tax=Lycium barbarum TaxID=112863 RepID=UPI00293E28A0|nr:uncharacterized protein LOC132611853 [Lycium barbarum]